ncbi:hypothetical protein DRN69_08370 [Candidatus Pacearchaeota archaeon]|nr:MAG: hypothetical protein DRN69_08370 [Candidatus Pacearchaeota archaeon]
MGRKFGWRSGKVTAHRVNTETLDTSSGGKQIVKYRAMTASGAILSTDHIIGVDTSSSGASAAVTLTIASGAYSDTGRIIIINDEGGDSASNAITIATEDSSTIDGSATATINTNNSTLGLYSNGTNWFSY